MCLLLIHQNSFYDHFKNDKQSCITWCGPTVGKKSITWDTYFRPLFIVVQRIIMIDRKNTGRARNTFGTQNP